MLMMCNIDITDGYVPRVKMDFNSIIDDKHYAHCKMVRERKFNNIKTVKMDRRKGNNGSKMWHKGDEKPELYNKWIIIKYDNYDYVGTHQVRKYGDWVNMIQSWPSFHWAYIDDFLSEEDE